MIDGRHSKNGIRDTALTGQNQTLDGFGVDREERFSALVDGALILEGILLLFFTDKHRVIGDGMTRFISLRLLFERGELSDMPYSMIGPIFATPLYVLDRLAGTPMWWAERYNFFVLLFGLILLHRLLKPHLSGDVIRKFLLLLIIGSMFARHQLDFYGEVFTAVLAGVGLLSLSWRSTAWGWLAVLLAVANTPAAIVGLGFVSVALAFQQLRWRYLALPVGAAALILGEAWLRRGDPMLTGYEGAAGNATLLPYSGKAGFSYPFFFGVISILFSFGKGIVFFAPGLLLPVKERITHHSAALWKGYQLWLLFLAGMIIVYAKWWSWYGGWYWGPRFFLFASVPASFALAIALGVRKKDVASNVFLLLVLLLSVFGAVNGMVYDQWGLEVCTQDSYALESFCWYVPEFSVLFHPFVSGKPLTSADYTLIAFAVVSFVWLALPVVRDVGAGCRDWGREIRRRSSDGFRF